MADETIPIQGSSGGGIGPIPAIIVIGPQITWVDTVALDDGAVVSAVPAFLFYAFGWHDDTAEILYFQIFNAAAVPANGTVPQISIAVPISTAAAQGTFSLDIHFNPRHFTNGISWCVSTTGPTKTISAVHCWCTFGYLAGSP